MCYDMDRMWFEKQDLNPEPFIFVTSLADGGGCNIRDFRRYPPSGLGIWPACTLVFRITDSRQIEPSQYPALAIENRRNP